jgi:hypothetical protein
MIVDDADGPPNPGIVFCERNEMTRDVCSWTVKRDLGWLSWSGLTESLFL